LRAREQVCCFAIFFRTYRCAETLDHAHRERTRSGDADLLSEHGTHCDLETIPTARQTLTWIPAHACAQACVASQLRVDCGDIGIQIEHAPHARTDRLQLRGILELHA